MIVEDEILDELAELEWSIEAMDKMIEAKDKAIEELRKKIKLLEG